MDENIPDFLKRLKNKLTYYIYKTVNDDDANKYIEEKEKKKDIKENLTETDIKNTASTVSTNVSTAKDNAKDQLSLSRIFDKISDKAGEILPLILYPIISLYVACLIANELIMYPAAIRLIFFIFVCVLCNLFGYIGVSLLLFYIGKKLYEIYLNRKQNDDLEESNEPKEPIKLMPTIFALLPLTTYRSDNALVNVLLYPFRYLKGNSAVDDNEILQTIMKKYTDSLKESFPYIEKVSGDELFKQRTKEFDKAFKKLHVLNLPKPESNENISNESVPKEPANAPLPKEPANAPLSKEPANAPLSKEPAKESTNAPMPPTIQELENKKKESEVQKEPKSSNP
jgi:hypothetical protein